ncbi:MAG: DUF368 domain-containing protein [Actinomycetota bacterium]
MQIPSPITQLARGFAMGAADIVPGVSGGTVALVLGIYTRVIDNVRLGARGLKQLLTGNIAECRSTMARIEWVWLVALLTGILTAIVLLASIIEQLLLDQPVRTAAAFFGLVAGSVWVAGRMVERWDRTAITITAVLGVAMFLMLGLRTNTEVPEGATTAVTQPLWIFFLTGAIAVCAMILPGVSGSFLLVMMGMYLQVIDAIDEREYAVLAAFGLGCVIGLALFSTVLHHMLDRYRSWVLAAMVGMLLGSTRVLWAWPDGTNTTILGAPRGDVLVPVLLAVAAAALVVSVDFFSRRNATTRELPPIAAQPQLTSAAMRSMPSTKSSSPSANENRP